MSPLHSGRHRAGIARPGPNTTGQMSTSPGTFSSSSTPSSLPAESAAQIFALATSAGLSRVVAVALRAGLFGSARDGLTVAQAGGVLGCPERPARMVTDVLVAGGYLVRDGHLLRPSPLALAHLLPDQEGYLGDLLLMFDRRVFGSWGRLEEAMRDNRPVVEDFRDHPPTPEEAQALVAEAIGGLHGMTLLAGRALARAFDFSEVRRVLDLGAGTGAMSIALLQAWPRLEALAVDMDPVIDVIRERAARAGVADRIQLLALDFFRDPLPSDVDAVILSNVLHDWSREQGHLLLERAFGALRSGGQVLINEWLIDDDRQGPLSSTMLSLCMLLETPAGENLTGHEVAACMTRVGFGGIEVVSTLPPHGVVRGFKP